MRPALPRRSHGFTLVELLVVIGIITILASLLLPVLGKVGEQARAAECGSNLGQLYKAARQYAPYYRDFLPNLYQGVDPVTNQVERYRKSYLCRSTTADGATVAAGLWLLKTTHYADDENVFYCPNLPGSKGPGGSQNQMENDIPESVGYSYNYWPDSSAGLAPPPSVDASQISNSFSYGRAHGFYALMGDRFENSLQMPHIARNGMNVCYWDGSVQFVDLGTGGGIPWNDTDADDAEIFSDAAAGSEATRDAWTLLSQKRK
jgi:prepilin-type N-terminal cleavage/methylation domain-containing protein/prepilin-type processing-associated H-X9-DG protein